MKEEIWIDIPAAEAEPEVDAFDVADDDIAINTNIRVTVAYEQLFNARCELHNAHEAVEVAQDAHDDAERDMILGGHVVGKNEAERAAKMADLLRAQIAHLRDAKRRERGARLDYETALDGVQRIKLLAQFMGV